MFDEALNRPRQEMARVPILAQVKNVTGARRLAALDPVISRNAESTAPPPACEYPDRRVDSW